MIPAIVRGTLSGGAHFHGRYRIVRALSAGGMGAVYEVFDETTRSPRALKVMLPSVVGSPEHRARFEQEARLTGAIDSEHLVRILDAGVEGNVPFLVMDLLRGEDLRSVLAARGTLPADEALVYLRQIALALEKTHAAGIVHRDLKPGNLFVTRRDDGSPCMKILDFGVAKLAAASAAQETSAVGTPFYMAPEQARGDGRITGRADLLALAHVAYTMLVGEAYYAEELESSGSVVSLILTITEGPSEPPCARAARRRRVGLPPGFDGWFLRAAAPAPDARYGGAREQIEALAVALSSSSPRTSAPVLRTVPLLAVTATPLPRAPQPPVEAQTQAPPSSVIYGPISASFAQPPATPISPGDPSHVTASPLTRANEPSVARAKPIPQLVVWGLVLAIGLGITAIALTLGSSGGKSSTPSSSAKCAEGRCVELHVADPAHVEPTEILDESAKLAEALDPEVKLVSMLFVKPVLHGEIDLRSKGPVLNILYQSQEAMVAVSVQNGRLEATIVDTIDSSRMPIESPPCSLKKAWKAAVAGGLPKDQPLTVVLMNLAGSRPLWTMSADSRVATVGAKACKLDKSMSFLDGPE